MHPVCPVSKHQNPPHVGAVKVRTSPLAPCGPSAALGRSRLTPSAFTHGKAQQQSALNPLRLWYTSPNGFFSIATAADAHRDLKTHTTINLKFKWTMAARRLCEGAWYQLANEILIILFHFSAFNEPFSGDNRHFFSYGTSGVCSHLGNGLSYKHNATWCKKQRSHKCRASVIVCVLQNTLAGKVRTRLKLCIGFGLWFGGQLVSWWFGLR